jgi:glutamate racemase
MDSDKNKAIGVFDSGVGGLSVWKEIVQLLPQESTIYLADSAHCPYGTKPLEEIRYLAEQNTHFLLNRGCRIIVVACNTATAAAIDYLRQKFPVPFIGMEPAVKPAALHSQSGHIGVLATHGTFKGRLYKETSERFSSLVEVREQAGDGLVELVEEGKADSPESEILLRKYIQPMLDAGIDHLVLGCTHYPFLTSAIRNITGSSVTIVNPSPAVARHLKEVMEEKVLLSLNPEPIHSFYTTGRKEILESLLKQFYSGKFTIEEVSPEFNV